MASLDKRLAKLEAADRQRYAPQGRAVSGLAAEVRELDQQIAELEEITAEQDNGEERN